MTPAQEALVERLRSLFANEPVLREVSMFGGRSFMVNEKLAVSALKSGGLLVRVDAEQHTELLTRPGAQQATMGADREMGPGWIEVEAATVEDDENLAAWLDIAMEHNRQVS